MGKYEEVFRKSIDNPRAFWQEAAQDIDWYVKSERILDDSNPPFYRWFPDGELNTCHNAVDRHVASGRAEQPAIIYDSPVTGTVQKITYRQLQDKVAGFAGSPRRTRGKKRRHSGHLYADGPRSGGGHAGLCQDRRHPFRGVRRFRPP